ncbi:MAG TPA: hypothetical protein VMW41_00805 [Candidatus Bathyarchaeia archaeon]|nr:hypothetical protein [Candidatus Bathyarchaeia archaeon]
MNQKLLATSLGSFQGFGKIGTDFLADPVASLEKIISLVIGIMTIGAGIYFIFLLIIAAYGWMSAGGDKQKMQKAQDSFTQAIIGLVVVVAAYAIASVVGFMLGVNILNPSELLGNIWSTST